MATAYNKLPSEILGLPAHSWQAWNMDVTCLQVGRWIEAKLEERDKQGKPLHSISKLLRDAEAPKASSEFRSMSGLAVRKVAIPESGIW